MREKISLLTGSRGPRPLVRPGGMGLTRRMLETADFLPGARLLDVCCGAGATVEMLLGAGFDAWGIDLEPRADGLPLVQGSASDLPCEDASLDGILCECSFSLLEPQATLGEFSRVLKSGGALLISDLYSRTESGRMGALRVHTKEELAGLMLRNGFGLQIFEDCTDALKSFVAEQIMEHGSDWLCEEYGARKGPIKCGYCFFMARKMQTAMACSFSI